jgi:hypothetical protein
LNKLVEKAVVGEANPAGEVAGYRSESGWRAGGATGSENEVVQDRSVVAVIQAAAVVELKLQ